MVTRADAGSSRDKRAAEGSGLEATIQAARRVCAAR